MKDYSAANYRRKQRTARDQRDRLNRTEMQKRLDRNPRNRNTEEGKKIFFADLARQEYTDMNKKQQKRNLELNSQGEEEYLENQRSGGKIQENEAPVGSTRVPSDDEAHFANPAVRARAMYNQKMASRQGQPQRRDQQQMQRQDYNNVYDSQNMSIANQRAQQRAMFESEKKKKEMAKKIVKTNKRQSNVWVPFFRMDGSVLTMVAVNFVFYATLILNMIGQFSSPWFDFFLSRSTSTVINLFFVVFGFYVFVVTAKSISNYFIRNYHDEFYTKYYSGSADNLYDSRVNRKRRNMGDFLYILGVIALVMVAVFFARVVVGILARVVEAMINSII